MGKLGKNFYILIFSLFISIFLFVAPVKAQPNAISDLRCFFSEMSGAVWLTWTPPAGTVSYDVRYALSAINESNYNLATQFPQSWSGSTNKGLVDYLIANNTWFFAMKAVNATGSASGISNVVWCFVPTVATQRDTTPPTSFITNPAEGATILAGKDYLIFGQSSDTGGSSVQKVEISFDGGQTWFLTNPKESITSGFTFEYLWTKQVAGNYNIKTKSTDWVGNIETPGAGINLTVAVQSPVVEPPASQPPVEKPIAQMTVEELRLKITEIQQQIIQLLKELIFLLQQQLVKI
jgi:hypothetical protein